MALRIIEREQINTNDVTCLHPGVWGNFARLCGDVSGINGDVSNISGDATLLEGDVSNLRGDVTKIHGIATGLRGDVSGLYGAVTEIYGDASRIHGKIGPVRGDVSSLEGDVSNFEGNATAFAGKIPNKGRRTMRLALFIALLTYGLMNGAHAQPLITDTTRVLLAPTAPGTYTINTDSQQQVMATYEITSLNPANRANLIRWLIGALKNDGRNGGSATTAVQTIQGVEHILLNVVATETLQASIPDTIRQFNRGPIEFLAPGRPAFHYTPEYRSAADLAAILNQDLSPLGTVYVDDKVNRLTIAEDPTYIPHLQKVLAHYDVQPEQVTVSIEIIETRKGLGRDLGVYWESWKKAFPTLASVAVHASRSPQTDNLTVDSIQALIDLNPAAFTSFVHYMEIQGVANVRSKTTLTVVNAQPASFKTATDTPVTATNDPTHPTTTRVTDGIEISIAPTISRQLKNLRIKAVATSLVGFTNQGDPQVTTSSLETTIEVQKNGRYLLSGLEQQHQISQTHGIPLLGTLPLLKYLFSWQRATESTWDISLVLDVQQP